VELDSPYDIKLVFVQKITFLSKKINKNCCDQNCTFSLQYAPNRLSAGALPQTQMMKIRALPQTPYLYSEGLLLKGREGRGVEGR